MARSSGSDKRRRSHMFSIRFSRDEDALAKALSDRTGLTLAALIRRALFGTNPPRAARRPTVNHQAVARLLAQLGKIGSNLNQLARQAHTGRYPTDSLEEALRELSELRLACLQALGREPESGPSPADDSAP